MKKKVKRIVPLLLALMMLIGLVPAPSANAAGGAENAAISSTKSENDFVLAESGTVATIWVDDDEEQPVQRVAEDLQSDVLSVTGKTLAISSEETMPEGPVVIVGTLGKSAKINELVNDGTITAEEKAAIEGEWEAYLIKVVDKDTLVIAGSDNRGAIYGVYKISEEMGVSPWHYFADVPVQTKEEVYIPAGTVLIDKPDVQYRGLFINDEEKLYQWVQEAGGLDQDQNGTYQFGPEFYSKLFELILRLGGNYFWPAMHMVGFNNTEANISVLQEYGVVFGTSHCDMLGRTNKHEWNAWCASKGYNLTLKDWDYTVHRDKMMEYWREGVERHKDSDVQWTVGLRGNSDEPMITTNLQILPGETEEDAKTRLLIQAMQDQYQILKDVLGEEKAEKAFKVFVPYKEVLPLYNNQIFQDFLKSDECFDFTTMWCNDNHGMVRNLPNAEERAREGGNALYYHLSYWAPKDQSYMWMSSMSLSVMGEELNKSWESGIQKAWIVNVGDIKPAEGELDYFMRCGWDVDYTTNSIDFSTEWMLRNFSNQMSVETADEVADILNTFYHHSNVRKIEQMRLDVFEQMNFNEWDKRMATSQDLYERVAAVAESLTTDAAKDSFYELVQSKINWTYFTNKMFYYADKSNLAYDQGRMASADTFSKLSIAADGERKAEIRKYSTIVDGKWDGFIDPENYDVGANFAGAPVTSQSPATSPVMVLGETEMGAIVQGEAMPTTEASQLTFSRYGQDGKFIDIFNKGARSFEWTASSDAEWVTLSKTSGTVCDEERVWVTVNDYDKAAEQTATITITDGTTTKEVGVTVENVGANIENIYVEADGYVSMQAEHYSSKNDVGNTTWQLVENAGRGYDGDMMRSYDADFGEVNMDNIAGTRASLTYEFYLTSEGEFDLEIYRLPTLNATGKVRFAVAVDNRGDSFTVVSSTATDEGTSDAQNEQWAENLYHQIEKHLVDLPHLKAGNHTLTIWMVDNFISLDKLVVYTDGIPKSELGPDESYHSKYNPNFTDSVPVLDRNLEAAEEKNITDAWGSGNFVEAGGKVYIEAEYAMENVLTSSNEVTQDILNSGAYTVTHNDLELPEGLEHNAWMFTQSDTGHGVYSPNQGDEWPTNDATMEAYGFRTHSPELAYRINFTTPGWYYVWARVRTVDYESEGFYFSEDTWHYGGWISDYWTHEKDEKWTWVKVTKDDYSGFWVEQGGSTHTYNIWMHEDGIYIDRIYMTLNPNEVPSDDAWKAPLRSDQVTPQQMYGIQLDAKKADINKYSYPIGTEVGCYSQTTYDALQTAITDAQALANGETFDATAGNNALAAIDTAYQAFIASLNLTDENTTYLFHRNFENDTSGQLFPYGMNSYAISGSGSYEIVTEGENNFLRLFTGSAAGSAQMSIPYTVSNLTDAQRVIVEFSARATGVKQDASAWVAMSSNSETVTTMLFNKGTSGVDVLLKDASNTNTIENVTSSDWHDYKMVLDMTSRTYDLYMDNSLVVSDYKFRNTNVTDLIGHRFGINNKANTTIDFDNFKVCIGEASADIVTTFKSSLTTKTNKINSYSYPVGDGVGCYSQESYDALQSAITEANELATNTTLTQNEANGALEAIGTAYKTFTDSLILTDNGKEYLFYRDFEGDIAGSLMPYGMKEYQTVSNGTREIVDSLTGNTFLRLTTGTTAGSVQMTAPYTVSNLAETERLIVEFSARVVKVPGGTEINMWASMDENSTSAQAKQATHITYLKTAIRLKTTSSNQDISNIKTNTWYNYKAVVNMSTKTYDLYIDGVPVYTGYPFRDTSVTEFTGHRFGIASKQNTTVDFDNIKVSISEVDNLEYSLKTSHINIRDPFVLPYEGKYYMYGTRVGDVNGFDVYVSKDLENWSTAKTVFKELQDEETGEATFWGTQDYWAPEVYEYDGKFYMFATFKGETGCRGTSVLVSDKPDGMFTPHSEGALTPSDMDCLDGTLYIEDDVPYMVFCHEWTQIGDGAVYAVQLSDDLSTTAGNPFKLWSASQASWAYDLGEAGYAEATHEVDYVTDGPYLIKINGELVALWSSFTENGYVVAVSRSDNGKITGNWTVDNELFYDKDGGHGMVFETFESQTKFVYHTPNTDRLERPCFKNIKLSDLKK